MQRDLDSLEASHWALGITANRQTKPYSWAFDRHRSLDFLALDTPTAIAFDQAGHYLNGVLPEASYQAIAPFVDKARVQLARAPNSDKKQWSKKYYYLPEGLQLLPAKRPKGLTAIIYDAVLDETMIEVTRTASTKPETLLPYGIVDRRRAQYLVATYSDNEKLYTFRIDRFTKALNTGQSFTRKRFSLSAYAKQQFIGDEEFINIKLAFFNGAGEHLKETPLSTDQKVVNTMHRNRPATVVTATIQDTDELRWWILNFHNQIEVLNPPSLRAEIKDNYQKALQNYRSV